MQLAATLHERLTGVRQEITEAVVAAGRDENSITLIVVTKFHPIELVRNLYDLGVRDVGENRHQDAESKALECADLADLSWHFIGQLQSNKARAVRRYADVIHSVDRPSLVDALAGGDPADRKHPVLDVLVQMNLTSDGARGGASDLDDMLRLAEKISTEESLSLRGIMAVAPLDESPSEAFARVQRASEILTKDHPAATWLSMGMSHDFAEAIAHGATHLRIGTAITGYRPAAG
jgi:pyridoxal phosphate enzyme (YggS family)